MPTGRQGLNQTPITIDLEPKPPKGDWRQALNGRRLLSNPNQGLSLKKGELRHLSPK